MPVFLYEAVKKDGEKIKGSINLASEQEVRVHLRQKGVRPTKISKESIFQKEINITIGKPVSDAEVAIMTRQLSVMIESGVPLLQCLDILEKGEKNPKFKEAIAKVAESVGGGNPLWESLSAQKGIFNHLYIYLVRAGEFGGSLDVILKRLAKYLDDNVKLVRKVKGAMIYPAVILAVGLLVTFGLIVFVVPQFESLITSSGGELPGITQFVLNLSDFCTNNFFSIILFFVAISVAFKQITKNPDGKKIWHQLLLKVPVMNELIIKSSTARMSRTLGTMLSSGVNLIDALEVCKMTLDNVIIQEAISNVKENVSSGQNMALPLAKTKLFPPMVVQMVNVGENTGALDQMLIRLADFYEDEVEVVINAMTKLIEPIVLVVLGGIVAVILIAMYLPVFQLSSSSGI